MYEVRITGKFNSAHNLRNYKGKCENLHGHTWKVEVFIKGDKLSSEGFLCDFIDVKSALKNCLDKYDHQYLNELPPFDKINPTAENLAHTLFTDLKEKFPGLYEVVVWESEDARAAFRLD